MTCRTEHNRVERRIYTFTRADVEQALRDHVTALPFGRVARDTTAPVIGHRWTVDVDTTDDGHLTATLTQTFEYAPDASSS